VIAVPIRYRRSVKALFVQKLQHALPSIVVLSDGLAHFADSGHAAEQILGAAEVAVAAAVIGSVIWGVRQLQRQTAAENLDHLHEHGVDWIDIAIGAMLSVEAVAKYEATAHIPRPTILLALTMFVVGVLHPRLARYGDRKRELRITDNGVSIPGGKFTRLTLAWDEVAAIDFDDRYATVTAVDGRSKRIDLKEVFHPTAVREALMHARTTLEAARQAAPAAASLASPASPDSPASPVSRSPASPAPQSPSQ
jgi:hypothetical protein